MVFTSPQSQEPVAVEPKQRRSSDGLGTLEPIEFPVEVPSRASFGVPTPEGRTLRRRFVRAHARLRARAARPAYMSRRSRGGDGQIQDGGEGRVRGGVGFGRFRDGVWLKMHHPLVGFGFSLGAAQAAISLGVVFHGFPRSTRPRGL